MKATTQERHKYNIFDVLLDDLVTLSVVVPCIFALACVLVGAFVIIKWAISLIS